MTKEMDEKRAQVAAQYKAVAHMAEALMSVHLDIAPMIEAGGPSDRVLETRGKNSARLMEVLGDILNDMDANDGPADEWMDPIFAEAQRRWPVSP
jgi:N-acetylmuramoyl-L-alanine amidase